MGRAAAPTVCPDTCSRTCWLETAVWVGMVEVEVEGKLAYEVGRIVQRRLHALCFGK